MTEENRTYQEVISEVPYRDDYDASKRYTQILALPGTVTQAREFTQVQTLLRHFLQELGNTLMRNGNIVEGCELVRSGDSLDINITKGSIYVEGVVHPVDGGQFTLTGEGEEIIGVKLLNSIITEVQDSSLRDPALGFDNYNQPGNHRLKQEAVLALDDPDSYLVYKFQDGVLVREITIRPEMENLLRILAKRTNDESGSYVVHGMEVELDHSQSLIENKIRMVLTSGLAYISGWEIEKSETGFLVDQATATRQIDNEPKTYYTANSTYNLAKSPVKNVVSVFSHVERTHNVTKGIPGGKDELLYKPVSIVKSVSAGSTLYHEGVDFFINDTNYIDWSLGGSEPASGASYSVTYCYNKNMTPGVDFQFIEDDTVFPAKGKVEFLSGDRPDKNAPYNVFMVSYNIYLARKDLIYIDHFGNIHVEKGDPDVFGKEKFPLFSHENRLILGILTVAPNSLTPVYQDISIKGVTMGEINKLIKRTRNLEYNQTISDLDREAIGLAPVTDLRGVFTDGFIGFSKVDLNHSDSDVCIDVFYNSLTVGNEEMEQDLSIDEDHGDHSVTTHFSLLTNNYDEILLLDQPYATDHMLLNPYEVFVPDRPNTKNLTVQVIGDGHVFPYEGSHSYEEGTGVLVVAVPEDGNEFTAWSGGPVPSDSSISMLTMDQDRVITATFAPISPSVVEYTLNLSVSGSGTILPVSGSHTYNEDTVVNLVADPSVGNAFVEWVGDVEDSTSTVTTTQMGDHKSILARFREAQSPLPPIDPEDPEIPTVSVLKLNPSVDNWVDSSVIWLDGENIEVPLRFLYAWWVNYPRDMQDQVNRNKDWLRSQGVDVSEIERNPPPIGSTQRYEVTGDARSEEKFISRDVDPIDFMRSGRKVTIKGEGFKSNVDNLKIRFAGREVVAYPEGWQSTPNPSVPNLPSFNIPISITNVLNRFLPSNSYEEDHIGSQPGSLMSDENGIVEGYFNVPSRVRCGTVKVELFCDSDKAEASYTSRGNKVTTTMQRAPTTYVNVRWGDPRPSSGPPRNYPIPPREYSDPIAQSFGFDRDIMISSVELFFKDEDPENLPIRIQIRNMVNGFPGQEVIAEKLINGSDVVGSEDSSVGTKVDFDDPVFCAAGNFYCVTALTESNIYSLWYAEGGNKDLLTEEYVTTQPYGTGVMFTSSNAITWTPHQARDIKFKLYCCHFEEEGKVFFEDLDFTDLSVDFVEGTPTTYVGVSGLSILSEVYLPEGTHVHWEYGVQNPHSGEFDFYPALHFDEVRLDYLSEVVKVRATLEGDEWVSPVISMGTLSLVGLLGKESSTYVSRNAVMHKEFDTIRQIYDQNVPSGCTVKGYIATDQTGTTWSEVDSGVELIDLGYNWYQREAYIDIGENKTNFRAKVELVTNHPTKKPRVANFKNIMTDENP